MVMVGTSCHTKEERKKRNLNGFLKFVLKRLRSYYLTKMNKISTLTIFFKYFNLFDIKTFSDSLRVKQYYYLKVTLFFSV